MKTTATGFSKEKRFLVQNQKEKQNALSPSPSQYNSNIYNTISSTLYNKNSSRTGKLNLASSLSCSNKNKFNTHMYYKELERGYYYSISPGPAAYKNSADIIKSLSHTKNSASCSFPKSDRNLAKQAPKSKFIEPGPQSYSNLVNPKNIKGGKIGSAGKGVDFTQVHSIYERLITKGLV